MFSHVVPLRYKYNNIQTNESDGEESEQKSIKVEEASQTKALQSSRSMFTVSLSFLLLFIIVFILVQQNFINTVGPAQETAEGIEPRQCLSFDHEVETLINSSEQIFILTPAKTAGSSFSVFTKECTDSDGLYSTFYNIDRRHHALTKTFELPRIASGHVMNDKAMISIMQGMSDDSLLIYVHRSETDRLVSAIRHVVSNRVCELPHQKKQVLLSRNETACVVSEKELVDSIIVPRFGELGFGAPEILTCEVFQEISEANPNLVFIHYKQSNRLQSLLAKKYCPRSKTVHITLAEKRTFQTFVKLDSITDEEYENNRISYSKSLRNAVVTLEDWLHAKSRLIEWLLDLRQSASCQAETKKMEKVMFGCVDRTMRILQ